MRSPLREDQDEEQQDEWDKENRSPHVPPAQPLWHGRQPRHSPCRQAAHPEGQRTQCRRCKRWHIREARLPHQVRIAHGRGAQSQRPKHDLVDVWRPNRLAHRGHDVYPDGCCAACGNDHRLRRLRTEAQPLLAIVRRQGHGDRRRRVVMIGEAKGRRPASYVRGLHGEVHVAAAAHRQVHHRRCLQGWIILCRHPDGESVAASSDSAAARVHG